MSHVTAVDLEIRDLDALAEACEDCGLELMRDQKTWKWYGIFVNDYHGSDAAYQNGIRPEQYGVCDHAIRVKDDKTAYEAGLYAQPDGSFKMAFDFWGAGRKMKEKIGNGGGLLKQAYAKAVAVRQLKKKGFVPVRVDVTADNKIKVVLRG